MGARVIVLGVALAGLAVWASRALALPAESGGQVRAPEAWPELLNDLSAVAESALGVVDDAVFDLSGVRVVSGARWQAAAEKPENAELVALMHGAESRYGIPPSLVVRLAWQESRFNISAHNASSDASGIMQIVPRWHPDIDPWNPPAAIDYGARYLAQLYRQFGTWELALKAYNWGPGNVARWIAAGRPATEPLETQNYSAQILADLAAAGMGVA